MKDNGGIFASGAGSDDIPGGKKMTGAEGKKNRTMEGQKLTAYKFKFRTIQYATPKPPVDRNKLGSASFLSWTLRTSRVVAFIEDMAPSIICPGQGAGKIVANGHQTDHNQRTDTRDALSKENTARPSPTPLRRRNVLERTRRSISTAGSSTRNGEEDEEVDSPLTLFEDPESPECEHKQIEDEDEDEQGGCNPQILKRSKNEKRKTEKQILRITISLRRVLGRTPPFPSSSHSRRRLGTGSLGATTRKICCCCFC
ncbi:hypothetical protein K438DRAFT_1755542 [Mycena galopus ATCC 62051]|nr:hypothetical protein K438DRAFT_1755542 [Mycena galopus ATCC 62051]